MASKKHVQLSEEEKFNLITLWEAEVVLYDHNNNKRTAGLQRISEEMDSETTVDDIKFHLRGLRTTYMKERKARTLSHQEVDERKFIRHNGNFMTTFISLHVE